MNKFVWVISERFVYHMCILYKISSLKISTYQGTWHDWVPLGYKVIHSPTLSSIRDKQIQLTNIFTNFIDKQFNFKFSLCML